MNSACLKLSSSARRENLMSGKSIRRGKGGGKGERLSSALHSLWVCKIKLDLLCFGSKHVAVHTCVLVGELSWVMRVNLALLLRAWD